jgi:prepilin-type N-terminal cleavage/methylation domain-containing protein
MPTMTRGDRAKQPAFTLVELLVVSAVMSIVMGALFTSLLIGRSSYVTGDAYVQVQQEARRALDIMGRELRAAQVTADPAGGSTLDFQAALGYNLTGVPGCPADAICWGAVDQAGVPHFNWSVRYSMNGSQLVREIHNPGVVSSTVMSNNVQQATFYYDAVNKVVTITVGISQVSNQLPGGSMAVPALATRVTLRN